MAYSMEYRYHRSFSPWLHFDLCVFALDSMTFFVSGRLVAPRMGAHFIAGPLSLGLFNPGTRAQRHVRDGGVRM